MIILRFYTLEDTMSALNFDLSVLSLLGWRLCTAWNLHEYVVDTNTSNVMDL